MSPVKYELWKRGHLVGALGRDAASIRYSSEARMEEQKHPELSLLYPLSRLHFTSKPNWKSGRMESQLLPSSGLAFSGRSRAEKSRDWIWRECRVGGTGDNHLRT